MGIELTLPTILSITSLINCADRALYKAKQAVRNRVRLCEGEE